MNSLYIVLICVGAVCVLGVILVYILHRQACKFKVSHIECEGIKPVKIVHLTDIHMRFFCLDMKKFTESVSSLNPDVIIMTGDYCEKADKIPAFRDFLKELLSGVPKAHCFFTFGNHDNKDVFEEYPGSRKEFYSLVMGISDKVKILENEAVQISIRGKKFLIGGLGDSRTNESNICDLVKGWDSKGLPLILASHNPDILLSLPEKSGDLLLLGHTHGGQVWMPFRLEFKLFHKDKLSKKGYIKGEFLYKGIRCYINNGLGCTLAPLRFMSTAEILEIN